MRSSDAARARGYPQAQITYTWEQLMKIAENGVEPQNFRHILSCVEFKAKPVDLKMEDFPGDIIPSLNEGGTMNIIVDGPEFRAAKRVESQAAGSRSRKRDREDDNLSQPRSKKRNAIAGPSRTFLPRSGKVSQVSQPAQVVAQASGSQPKTPQERTAKEKKRDPILQAGSYATEMLAMSRIEAWNLLIVGMCFSFGLEPSSDDRRRTDARMALRPARRHPITRFRYNQEPPLFFCASPCASTPRPGGMGIRTEAESRRGQPLHRAPRRGTTPARCRLGCL